MTDSNKSDGVKWNFNAKVEKYSPELVAVLTEKLGYEPVAADFARLGTLPDDGTVVVPGNATVNLGLANLTNLFIGGGGNAFSSAKAIVGVGATNTAVTGTQIALAGDTSSSTAWYQAPATPTRTTDATIANNTVQAVTTFATGDANFVWNEWCWAAAASGTVTAGATLASVATGVVMLNRKVAAVGTKLSGVWVFTTSVTFS